MPQILPIGPATLLLAVVLITLNPSGLLPWGWNKLKQKRGGVQIIFSTPLWCPRGTLNTRNMRKEVVKGVTT